MIILEDKFICRYSYECSEETYELESSSVSYLRNKMSELASDNSVKYTIYAVVEEGVME